MESTNSRQREAKFNREQLTGRGARDGVVGARGKASAGGVAEDDADGWSSPLHTPVHADGLEDDAHADEATRDAAIGSGGAHGACAADAVPGASLLAPPPPPPPVASGGAAAFSADPLGTFGGALVVAVGCEAPPAAAEAPPVVRVGQITRQMLHVTRDKLWERIAQLNNHAHGRAVVSLRTEPIPLPTAATAQAEAAGDLPARLAAAPSLNINMSDA